MSFKLCIYSLKGCKKVLFDRTIVETHFSLNTATQSVVVMTVVLLQKQNTFLSKIAGVYIAKK